MQKGFRATAVGAVLATALGFGAGGALAQTASDPGEPGKPLSLLQLLLPHHAAKKSEARVAAKPAPKAHGTARAHKTETRTAERSTHRKFHVADRHREPSRSMEHETAAATPPIPAAPTPAAPWPLNEMPASQPVTPAPEATAAAADPASAAAEPQVSELVVDGRTVQIASPDQVNPIDLAADQQADGQGAATAPPADAAATADASSTAQGDDADDDDSASTNTANAADATAAPDHVVAFAREADGESNHHPSWLAELLATLGGAIAAGSVAWFLIGSAPQRRLG
jgi:hypothetical protein